MRRTRLKDGRYTGKGGTTTTRGPWRGNRPTMILHVLRALFILLMGAVGYFLLLQPQQPFGGYTWLTLGIVLTIGVLIVCVDILSPRRKLAVFSGTFLGLLVGVFIAYALSFVVTLVIDNYLS